MDSSRLKPRAAVPGCSSLKSQPVRGGRRSLIFAMNAVTNSHDAETGFESPPRTMIPYSVSIPHTFGSAIAGRYRAPRRNIRLHPDQIVGVGQLDGRLAGRAPRAQFQGRSARL